MVSIILPNYNHAKFLEQRINSILNQTYRDFELIILDDNSTDNSAEIINSFRTDEKVSHVVLNENNSGNTFIQWNRGFNLASGEYIWIAESDDYADSSFLEKCMSALENDKDAVLCYSDSNIVNEYNTVIPGHWVEELIEVTETAGVIPSDGIEFLKNNLLINNYIYNASMVVFRKDALNGVSDFYKSYRICGDWAFWGEMISQGKVLRIPERLNNFRQHQNKVTSRMGSTFKNHEETIKVVMHLLSVYNNGIKRIRGNYENRTGEKSGLSEMIKNISFNRKNTALKMMIIGQCKNRIKYIRKNTDNIDTYRLNKDINTAYWYAPISYFLYRNFRTVLRMCSH